MSDNTPEVIDIGNIGRNTPVISLKDNKSEPTTPTSTGNSQPSVNFGGGIELLMNEKRKSDHQSPKSDTDLGDVHNLERELNDLTTGTARKTEGRQSRSSLFSEAINTVSFDDNITINKADPIELTNNDSIKIGSDTATTPNNNNSESTFDGYGKFKDIPMNPDEPVKATPDMTKEELLKEKFRYLSKLEALEKKGVTLTKKYNMDSPLAEMQGEYEMLVSEKEQSNSVKFQGRMLMAAITGLEFLNNRFDPFDLKLDGWSEQLNENIDDYDEIFGELHEKYKSKATMAPELKLLFQLGGSAVMVHMTNTMFKSSMPGMDDIMRQNPELAQQFSQAAANSMSDTNPGFSGFMNNVIGGSAMGGNNVPQQSMRPPPAPMETQTNKSASVNRPDMSAARGGPLDGINMENNFGNPNELERTQRRGPPASAPRPEMKGPSDINNILSGLKTKKIITTTTEPTDNSSTISISELKELSNEKIPRSKNRRRSDKNTVSLDI